MMSWSYKFALVVDCLALLVALYFIVSDELRSPGNIYNNTLKAVSLGFFLWLLASYLLHRAGLNGFASAMAWLPAIPILGYAFFVLAFIILKPDMK